MHYDDTHLSIPELTKRCTRYLENPDSGDASDCQALVDRAYLTKNDRAWDALVMLLRPYVLKAIFDHHPHLSPKEAEILLYMTLQQLRTHMLRHKLSTALSLQNILDTFERILG